MSSYEDNYGENLEQIKQKIRSMDSEQAIRFDCIFNREMLSGATYIYTATILKRCSFRASWKFYWANGGVAIPATIINQGGEISTPTAPLFVALFGGGLTTPIIDQRTVFTIPSGGFSPFLDAGTIIELTMGQASGFTLYVLEPEFQIILG